MDCAAGKSIVSAQIDSLGKVNNVKIIKSLSKEADSIAIEIIKNLKFHPALKNMRKVNSNRVITIPFED
jgi:TonB family protein